MQVITTGWSTSLWRTPNPSLCLPLTEYNGGLMSTKIEWKEIKKFKEPRLTPRGGGAPPPRAPPPAGGGGGGPPPPPREHISVWKCTTTSLVSIRLSALPLTRTARSVLLSEYARPRFHGCHL